jgi:tellurite resistance protein TerC
MEFLFVDWLGKPLWMWASFISIVLLLMAFDLGVLHKDQTKEIGIKESFAMTGFYIVLALLFGAWIWFSLGSESGLNYLTGFVIEKSLSMDNVFVIAMIFTYLGIPRQYQYRVLFWGILAVIVLRGLMIGVGAALVEQFSWVLYIFAAFLVYTGIKMIIEANKEYEVGNNPLLKFMKKHFNITDKLHGEKFTVRIDNKLWLTPMAVALVLVNIADIIFAVDSVPAIFAITTDTYIVYTSNIFAILVLRALYFALAAMVDKFAYLKYALATVLIFIGSKIFVADMLGLAKIPPTISLSVTLLIIASGVVYSLYKTRQVSH